jgi:putative transposase
VSGKYAFIDAECATLAGDEACAPTITQLCGWLGVSKSGYYDWRSRPQSATAQRRELLKIKIRALFEANNEEYGYRRMHEALARGGERCCPELVRQLMRELGLEPCQPKPWRRSLTEQGAAGPIPDLVNRDFTAGQPGEKMVGDITYIFTWEGWVYLATVIAAAIRMAARNLTLPEGAVFHSDRGSNYTSAEFAGVLEGLGIRQSVGRTGICYDNALAESWNGTLKVELVHRTVYPSREQAHVDIARWIELRYNKTRLHSGLGYRTPQEAMDEFLNGQETA